MEILLAKTAGYCFGVNNAVSFVEDAIRKNGGQSIYTLGPIIHNQQVIDKLNKRGVETIDQLSEIEEGTVVIRSHGVGEEIIQEALNKELNLINATCPYVKSIQLKAKKYYNSGYKIIIVGDKGHPEVIGINGWCKNSAIIIGDKNNVPNLRKYDKICVVAQTTITNKLFQQVTHSIEQQLSGEGKEVVIFNTICSATRERQEETECIARQVECMIIIGGRHSSNTQKLVAISKKYCQNTIHIETEKDLDIDSIKKYNKVGISAGASTPHWIIEEVINLMEKNDAKVENVKETYENAINDIRKGSIVKGKVISVSSDEVIVNIGYKTDGVIKKTEFTKDADVDLTALVTQDDEIEAVVLNIGSENVELSKLRLDERKAKDELQKAFEKKTVLNGKIVRSVKGGLIVDLGISEIFMPGSQYHYKFIKDLDSLVGKEVKGRIIEFDKRKNKAIFSQRIVLEEELKAAKEKEQKEKKEFFDTLEIGQKVSGKVKTVLDYGVFVDIGPIDGFIHVSDLSHGKIKHPSEVVKEGQEIEAAIINLDEEKQRIKLSIKELSEDPWTTFTKKYKKGDVVDVKITNILSFGAFAEIIPLVEGLIHISQISHEKVEKVESVLKKGQEVKAKIINIDNENKKISLSIKETIEPEKKPIQENKTVYKEDYANPTIGDLFGDLFK